MNSRDLAALLQCAVNEYEYPATEGALGKPWGADRVKSELALLRKSIVEPSKRTLHVHNQPSTHVWLVATLDRVAVYFDEERGEYGLGSLADDGSITDWGVYGDLVGTFMAR